MFTQKFQVPIFDIEIRLIQLNQSDDWNSLFKVIKHYELDKDLINWFTNNLSRHAKNGGITCSRLASHQIFIVFFPFTNDDRLTIVYDHEKRHTEDKILAFCGIDDKETSAYLAGYLGIKFKKFIHNVVQKFESNS